MYITEKEIYGKTEKQIDTAAFARDLAKELGGHVMSQEHGAGDRWQRIAIGDDEITLAASWRDKGKMHVTIAPHERAARAHIYGDKYKTADAYVSVSRPLKQVAADIKRRVITASQDALAARRQYAKDVLAHNCNLTAVAADLHTAFADSGLEVNVKANNNGDHHTASLYLNRDGAPYLSGSIDSHGSVSISHIGSMSRAQFERLMRALYMEGN